MTCDPLDSFLTALEESVRDGSYVRLTLAKHRGADATLRKLIVRPVNLAQGEHLCFLYRHDTKDVTKNMPVAAGLTLVRAILGADFLNANLFTTTRDIELLFNKKRQARLRYAKPSHDAPPCREHNRAKKRPIAASDALYLDALGVTSAGAVKKGMEAKYRQINKFIEIFAAQLRASPLSGADAISVCDMGCGKGYLTFALYDNLTRILKKDARVTGIEARPELVVFCNRVARAIGFANIHFAAGTIRDYHAGPMDVLIALHACDTATDEALFKGIASGASLILCAPCCHKELRPQISCAVPGLERVLKSGILLERQAELVTDGLRALLLEAAGYKTSVFEFIATEHTSKNIMIAAVKTAKTPHQQAARQQAEALKKAFGIKTQCLESLLRTAACNALGSAEE